MAVPASLPLEQLDPQDEIPLGSWGVEVRMPYTGSLARFWIVPWSTTRALGVMQSLTRIFGPEVASAIAGAGLGFARGSKDDALAGLAEALPMGLAGIINALAERVDSWENYLRDTILRDSVYVCMAPDEQGAQVQLLLGQASGAKQGQDLIEACFRRQPLQLVALAALVALQQLGPLGISTRLSEALSDLRARLAGAGTSTVSSASE